MTRILQWTLIGIFAFFITIWNAIAAEFTSVLKMDTATNTSIDISWEDVDWASGYYVFYWERPANWGLYDLEMDDLFENGAAQIPWLKEATKYYIAVSAIDENGDEIARSKEAVFETNDPTGGKKEKKEDLLLKWIIVTHKNGVKLAFNTEINSWESIDIIIKDKESGDELEVTDVEVIWEKVTVVLWNDLISNKVYEAVILSVVWTNGATITAGIEWAVDFTTPDVSTLWRTTDVVSEEEIEMNSASDQEMAKKEESNVDVQAELQKLSDQEDAALAAKEEAEKKKKEAENTSSKAWKDIAEWAIKKTPASVGKDSKNLPSTWPENTIFLLLSALIIGWLFLKLRSKTI